MTICASVVVAMDAGTANSQRGPTCQVLSTAAACGSNSAPAAIPAGMGGNRMALAACRDALTMAIASFYSYDDTTCRSTNSNLASIGAHDLQFVGPAQNFFPPNYKINLSQRSNFDAKLYCDMQANTLLLAFKGSVAITLMNRDALDDWFYNNFLQQLGDRTVQYQAAEDVAWLIEKEWRYGRFDGLCGAGTPKFMLTGHSKGGGQAQFAAVRNRLEAIVFNSAPVSPVIFNDFVLMRESWPIGRRVGAVRACGGLSPTEVRVYTAYFGTGKIHDVRMVNDPLTQYLFPICGSLLPHAPIEWLVNTLSCSSEGHAIGTVVRELHACAP